MPALTLEIARFIDQHAITDFPGDAIEKSKKVITDTMAAMLAGANSEVTAPLLAYLRRSGESGDSPVIGTAHCCSAETAALINGSFGHALDYDDVLSMMPAHPSAVILAALLAEPALRPFPGKALIEAYVFGIEVGGKIGLGITGGHYRRGFHATGTLGIFSGVAALAKACHLSSPEIQTALGIAASMASGLRRNFGTMTKPLHTGWAARSALAAVRLAQCGLSAAPDILESDAGFFAAYGTSESDPAVTLAALGKPWVISEPGIALKKFPCCHAMHRGMDGLLALRAKHGFNAGDVEQATCRMPPGGMQVLIYDNPDTGLEAKFSMQYALAAGIADGEYTLASFTDDAVHRPVIRALMPRVNALEDPSCRGDNPRFESLSSGSRGFVEVDITLRNGLRDTVRVEKPPGHPARELKWSELEQKFRDCAVQAGVDATRGENALSLLRTLETQPDVGSLVNLLLKQ